jgi:CRP/FNR family cyclic AMP-dependent transcriptional regulator
MSQHVRQLKAGEILFKEGEASDSMYVIKKGRLSVFKLKGTQEVELAEVGPGQMIGEMAFFDRKPRSAGVKATSETEIIELPFSSLQTQYEAFPQWLKSIVKTINEHLRDANKRIKNLEQAEAGISYSGAKGKTPAIAPHQANKLCAILSFVARTFGAKLADGFIDVKPGVLRKYTIQVFQEPTSKMNLLMTILQGLEILKQEDLGEGKVKISLMKPDLLYGFVEWFNEYLFTEEEKRSTVAPEEMKTLKAVIHFAKKAQPDEQGLTKVNLVGMQNDSMKELGYLVGVNDTNSLITKKILAEKISEKEGTFVNVKREELETLYPYWQMYYAITEQT